MKNKVNRIQGLLQRLADNVCEYNCSSMRLNSDKELVFFGCTGLREYGCERVVLDGVDMKVEITGQGLELKSFRVGEISVCGRIESVSLDTFEKGENR